MFSANVQSFPVSAPVFPGRPHFSHALTDLPRISRSKTDLPHFPRSKTDLPHISRSKTDPPAAQAKPVLPKDPAFALRAVS